MTKEEFDNHVTDLRRQKGVAVNAIRTMQSEVKEEIAALHRQFDDLKLRLHKLDQQRLMLAQRRLDTEREWGERIRHYIDTHRDATTRQLEDYSEWALINELMARGYHGTLQNPLGDQDLTARLNAKFNPANDDDHRAGEQNH